MITTLIPLPEKSSSRVQIVFFNERENTEFLAIPRIDETMLDGNFFQFKIITPSYAGLITKRKPYMDEELFSMDGLSTVTKEFDLSNLYINLTEPFQVRYYAMHPVDGHDQPMRAVISNWVTCSVK